MEIVSGQIGYSLLIPTPFIFAGFLRAISTEQSFLYIFQQIRPIMAGRGRRKQGSGRQVEAKEPYYIHARASCRVYIF